MKIIHGRDYYDFAHAGIDETVTFERTQEIITLEEDENPFRLEMISRSAKYSIFSTFTMDDGTVIVLEPLLVFAAGVAYPALRHAVADRDRDADELDNFTLNDIGADALHYGDTEITYERERALEMVSQVDPKKARDFSFGKGRRTLEQIVNDHFSVAPNSYEKFLIENHIITGFAYATGGRLFTKKTRETVVYKNINFLDKLQFPKVVDGFTLNQDIFRFISGVLPSPGASTVEIEDKYRIRKGGFDPKYGFRTRPKK